VPHILATMYTNFDYSRYERCQIEGIFGSDMELFMDRWLGN
jgi:hypothetical protein